MDRGGRQTAATVTHLADALSASSTAKGSDLLADAALTVAAAFAVAQHVVTAVWPVADREAADGRRPDTAPATVCPRPQPRTTRWSSRAPRPDRPAARAPFVHVGP
ncbi:hypothetical protein ACH4UM_12630 [Streptomyces sp. NPDC020801]|uniref:hypothetical protein n=1 Tax=unclassified Streptomyces TaxID=2593676 RepID=UPI0037BBC33C